MRGLCFSGLCDLDWARTLSGPGLERCGGSQGLFGVPAFQAPARAAFGSRNPAWLGDPLLCDLRRMLALTAPQFPHL